LKKPKKMSVKKSFLFGFFLLIFSQISFAQTVSADSLKEFAATYKMKAGAPFENFIVKIQDGYLFGEADGNGSNKLLKQKQNDTFLSTSSYGSTIVFMRDSKNKVIGLKLIIQGTELEAERIE